MSKKRLVFVINPGEDADILAWWRQQENKSAAVRAAIRVELEPTPTPLTTADVRRAVREELAQVNLAAQPDESAAKPQVIEDVDPDAAARLDNLF